MSNLILFCFVCIGLFNGVILQEPDQVQTDNTIETDNSGALNETDELNSFLKNVEQDLDNEKVEEDPMLDASKLAQALVEECIKLNISLTVLDPTSPEFNASTDWNIIDAITEGVQKIACDKQGIEEVTCPKKDTMPDGRKWCYYQIFHILDGYGGLGCLTQCDHVECDAVPSDELALEDDNLRAEKVWLHSNGSIAGPEPGLENTEAITFALANLAENDNTNGEGSEEPAAPEQTSPNKRRKRSIILKRIILQDDLLSDLNEE